MQHTSAVSLDGYEGDLRHVPFAGAAAYLVRSRATGALVLDTPSGTSRAFFLEGQPQGARLARIRIPLGRLLVRLGRISEDELRAALSRQAETQSLLGRVLEEQGRVTHRELKEAFALQSRLAFFSLFAEEEGTFSFRAGMTELVDFTPSPVEGATAIYTGLRDHASPRITAPLLARLAFHTVELNEAGRRIATRLPDETRRATAALVTPHTTAELTALSGLPHRGVGALLFSLFALRGLRVVECDSSRST